MDDKLKVFWNLDMLVKMCRSKSDGPSLRIEEEEILDKIETCRLEIEEIRIQSEEDVYDTSAEMADRNIEIITKKQLQTLKTTLKEKNKELNILKDEEKRLYENNALLRENKLSQEKYITSMQERINEATDYEVIDRYNGLIAETTEKISQLVDELEIHNSTYEQVQNSIVNISDEIANIEDKIDKKKKLLLETQASLENKDNYIDKTKREKIDKKIYELESKVHKATSRLEEIRKDPKYIETIIKDIINNRENIENARPYLISLINTVIKVPYINVPADNALEEELLKATHARDSFANEIEQKSYNILEANTPEKVRTEFLNERITLWKNELDELKIKVDTIDRDNEYNYEMKNQAIQEMIRSMKKDLREYEKAYAEIPDMNVGAKASVKAAMEEKRTDIVEAEKIVTAFRKDESEDIARATRTIKYECERLNQNIQLAEKEIELIKNRLTSKKSGLIDISSKNKDKENLKELAQTVIDIKHRRQFPETPLEILKRLETELNISIYDDIDKDIIQNTSSIVKKEYKEYEETTADIKRGIKVVEETEVETNIEEEGTSSSKQQEAEAELQSLISNIEEKENNNKKENEISNNESDVTIDTLMEFLDDPTPVVEETPVEETPIEEESTPVVEETPVEETPIEEESTPVAEETPVEETPIEEEATPVAEETPVVEAPIEEESTPVAEETPVVEAPIEEEATPIVEETPVEETPIEEEATPIVEETPVVEAPIEEEATPVVEETPVVEAPIEEEATPIVEETPVVEAPIEEESTPVVEETPVVETPIEEEAAPIVEETPVVEAPIEEEATPIVEETSVVETPIEEEATPVVEEIPVKEVIESDEDQTIDKQIDDIISNSKNTVSEEEQPLDIEAMFENIPTIETPKTTEDTNLSIDTIFNVETDTIDSEETTNESLANDFDQYINDLENKETQ